MPTKDDMSAIVMKSATDAVAPQISRMVDIGINGLIDAIMGSTREEKSAEMNAHYDRMLSIVTDNPIKQPVPRHQAISPRAKIEQDVRDSNDHIRNALEELNKAKQLSKCGVCKATIDDTINYVGEATEEILDISEKVLAMQRLKDVGELPPDAKWDQLTKDQKNMVNKIVDTYHPMKQRTELESEEDVEERNGKKVRKQGRSQQTRKGRKPSKR